MPVTRDKWCPRCKVNKSIDIANWYLERKKNGDMKPSGWCRECKQEAARAYSKARYQLSKLPIEQQQAIRTRALLKVTCPVCGLDGKVYQWYGTQFKMCKPCQGLLGRVPDMSKDFVEAAMQAQAVWVEDMETAQHRQGQACVEATLALDRWPRVVGWIRSLADLA